jgi:hypothetical protein
MRREHCSRDKAGIKRDFKQNFSGEFLLGNSQTGLHTPNGLGMGAYILIYPTGQNLRTRVAFLQLRILLCISRGDLGTKKTRKD